MTFNGGDHGLGQHPAGRSHRTDFTHLHAGRGVLAVVNGGQVGAGAECVAGTREDCHPRTLVVLETGEATVEFPRRRGIHSISARWPIDGDDDDIVVSFVNDLTRSHEDIPPVCLTIAPVYPGDPGRPPRPPQGLLIPLICLLTIVRHPAATAFR